MFDIEQYATRRLRLKERFSSGLLLFMGNTDASINSPYNHYLFRQDASFSYFFGLNQPKLAGLIDLDEGQDSLFGCEQSLDGLIWNGAHASLAEGAQRVGVTALQPYSALAEVIAKAQRDNRVIHYLPPYRGETVLELARLLSCPADQVQRGVSEQLIRAVVALREIKSQQEIVEIERALAVTRDMHVAAMRFSRPDAYEYEVVAEMERVMRRHNLHSAYPIIFTRSGEILHNHGHENRLRSGDLVVNDAGVSSKLGYASDITRVIPVGGRFSDKQRALYELLLRAQQHCIDSMRPDMPFMQLHKMVATILAEGMLEMGFFKGDPALVVESGAYAICFPHGLGHQMGLDVHDMESLGEELVGYDASVTRSRLFGLSNLRLAKPLRAGMVLTVEPGIYFIPELIKRWQAEARHRDFINYERFAEFAEFGGLRIEDNVLVTESAACNLSAAIPKSCAEIEEIMSQ